MRWSLVKFHRKTSLRSYMCGRKAPRYIESFRKKTAGVPSGDRLSGACLTSSVFPILEWCWGQKPPTMIPTDCFVLCTPTILPDIRISWDDYPTFMLISGRLPRSFTHIWASSCFAGPIDIKIHASMYFMSIGFIASINDCAKCTIKSTFLL